MHVPNFDFMTGFREFKWCEEKGNARVREPGKLRLHRAWPNSILHYNLSELKINDILFPLSFDLGEMGILWRYFQYSRWPEDQKKENTLMTVENLVLPPADHISSDNRVKNTQKWNTNSKDYVRKKPLRNGCDWGDLVVLSFVKHNDSQRSVTNF